MEANGLTWTIPIFMEDVCIPILFPTYATVSDDSTEEGGIIAFLLENRIRLVINRRTLECGHMYINEGRRK